MNTHLLRIGINCVLYPHGKKQRRGNSASALALGGSYAFVPCHHQNDPARKGELATRKQFFGENRRYAVAPIHTRFDALEWFVWDAEHPLSDLNHAEVIRQAETLEEALRGL